MGKHTQLQARSPNGDQLQVTAHDTDSPVLPVAQLKALQEFRPDLIDWVLQQTEAEATFRRSRQTRVDRYVFTERILGQVAGTLIAAFGLGIACYLAVTGHENAAIAVGGGTLVSIVTVLVSGRKPSPKPSANADTAQVAGKKSKS